MRRHINSRLTLVLFFALLIWLGMACSKSAKEEAVPAAAATSATGIAGDWKTSISTPEGDFELILHVRQSTVGNLSATMDIPVGDIYSVPLIFSFEDDVVHYEVEGYESSFEGKLTDPSTIEGASNQPDGSPFQLIFKRIE
ncbi:hypothetical protein ACFL4K_00425 [Candidatus Neomarinimicrobiota bacterium]